MFDWTIGKRFEATPQRVPDLTGLLVDFWSVLDPRKAKDQANENYAHGGGWFPMKGWIMGKDNESIIYPVSQPNNGEPDEEYALVAKLFLPLTSEWVCIFTHAWVAIVQPDGQFEVARMD